MALQFSTRANWDTSESALAVAVRRAKEAGRSMVDLTISNPTKCGFRYDPGLLEPLLNPEAFAYDPHPLGLRSAREAVAGYYAEHGAPVDPDHVVLTTSTSEAYSFLFRLLANAGDGVLVGQPGYPLFDFLADLEDVVLIPYPLFHDFGWWVDMAELERRITPQTRALVVVHPNNPTGHATSADERRLLEEICIRHDLALIVDEVFLDYGLERAVESFAVGPHPCLTFIVSGISKILALPQMKLGWIAGWGPPDLLRGSLSRLEVIADTFLSMNAPVQLAAPHWLEDRSGIQREILTRVRTNLEELAACAELNAMPVEAGWCAVLRLPQSLAGEGLAERVLEEANVLTHPGSFYGMPEPNRLIVSLLCPTDEFRRGVRTLNRWCELKD